MAKFGQAFLSNLTNPAYMGMLGEAAQSISAAPRLRKEKEDKASAMAMMNKAVASNDPQQLTAAAQALSKIPGMEAQALQLAQLAQQRSSQIKQGQIAALEVSGQEATDKAAAARKQAQMRRALQVAEQRTDTAALTALKEKALDPVEYLSGLATAQKPSAVSISPGGALVDSETGKVLYERGFKPPEPKAPDFKYMERNDGSISVFKDGEILQTVPAVEGANQDSALTLITQTTNFLDDLEQLKTIGFTEAGLAGAALSNIPGTAAYDREKELLTIRARLGFDQINEMKRLAAEAGSSGTGLGQISNIEFMSLQSALDAIYVGMSKEAQLEAITTIENHLKAVRSLASGVAAKDSINWDDSKYKKAGYVKDKKTGAVFYAPDGKDGVVYELINGKFEIKRG